MPYPYQNQQGAGFGGANFAVQSNPSPSAFPTLGNITAASRTYQQPSTPALSPTTPSGVNPVAGSKSINPFGSPLPDLSYADPRILSRLDISNLIYSPTAGGYLYSDRNYSGMGRTGEQWGGDNNANRQAASFYNYIGSLPTMERGSPALNQLNAASGARGSGPSLNSSNPNGFIGPYPFGRRNTLYGSGSYGY